MHKFPLGLPHQTSAGYCRCISLTKLEVTVEPPWATTSLKQSPHQSTDWYWRDICDTTVYSLSYNILLFCKTLKGCYSSGHTTFTPGQFTPPSELFTVALVSVWKEAPQVWRNCSRHFGNGCIVLPSCLTLMASFTQEWIRNFQTVLDRLKTNHISLFDTRTAQKPNEIIKL